MAKFIVALKNIFHDLITSWTVASALQRHKNSMDPNNIVVTRKHFTDKSTIGELYIDGNLFCYTLEDTCRRNKKVAGETAIPSGTYEIYIAESPKFGRPMPYLKDVKFFSGIMLHWGNSPASSEGCLLVGEEIGPMPDWISYSRKAFERLLPVIEERLRKGPLTISIMGGLTVEDLQGKKA
jgi:hypothetical protein